MFPKWAVRARTTSSDRFGCVHRAARPRGSSFHGIPRITGSREQVIQGEALEFVHSALRNSRRVREYWVDP